VVSDREWTDSFIGTTAATRKGVGATGGRNTEMPADNA
jgi:hypothetical protein